MSSDDGGRRWARVAIPREDRPRARAGFLGHGWTAGEDPPPAFGLRHARDVARAGDEQLFQVREAGYSVAAPRRTRGRPGGGTEAVLVGTLDDVDERCRDLALAGGHEDRFGLDGGHGAHGVVLEPEERDRFPVDGDVDVLGRDLVAAAELRLHPEDVLAVRGEVVRHHHPAPGAERRSLDLVPGVLRHLQGVAVLGGGGESLRVADGEAADVDGGLQIGVQQGGREALGGGHVVEAAHQQILGEPVVGVHLEPQEFVDDALVFRPAEPLKPSRAQVGERAGGLVDRGFERLHQR